MDVEVADKEVRVNRDGPAEQDNFRSSCIKRNDHYIFF